MRSAHIARLALTLAALVLVAVVAAGSTVASAGRS